MAPAPMHKPPQGALGVLRRVASGGSRGTDEPPTPGRTEAPAGPDPDRGGNGPPQSSSGSARARGPRDRPWRSPSSRLGPFPDRDPSLAGTGGRCPPRVSRPNWPRSRGIGSLDRGGAIGPCSCLLGLWSRKAAGARGCGGRSPRRRPGTRPRARGGARMKTGVLFVRAWVAVRPLRWRNFPPRWPREKACPPLLPPRTRLCTHGYLEFAPQPGAARTAGRRCARGGVRKRDSRRPGDALCRDVTRDRKNDIPHRCIRYYIIKN